jgi:hypothetical protein
VQYEAGSLMAVIQISVEIPPVGFQLFNFICGRVPSQPSNLKKYVSEIWIRFLEPVQIMDAPNLVFLRVWGIQYCLTTPHSIKTNT